LNFFYHFGSIMDSGLASNQVDLGFSQVKPEAIKLVELR